MKTTITADDVENALKTEVKHESGRYRIKPAFYWTPPKTISGVGEPLGLESRRSYSTEDGVPMLELTYESLDGFVVETFRVLHGDCIPDDVQEQGVDQFYADDE